MFNTDFLHIFFLFFFLISVQKVRSQTASFTWWTCETSRPPAGRLSCRWVLATVSCCGFKCWVVPIYFFWLFFFFIAASYSGNEVGTVGFSHYLFIKDMTRKWELPWRRLHKVSELYAELHCLLFCQERGAEWGAGGVFSFFSLLSFFPVSPWYLRLSLYPLWLKQWPANRPVRCGHFRIFKHPLKYFIGLRLNKKKKREKTMADAATLRGKVKKIK